MLVLSDVTLVAVDGVNPILALRALDVCMQQCQFGDALFFSPRAEEFDLPGCRMVPLPAPVSGALHHAPSLIQALLSHVNTSHVLWIQWDAHVVHAPAWQSEFLMYDYVGSPSVEGGSPAYPLEKTGFFLCSRRFLEALLGPAVPINDTDTSDLFRERRLLLESQGGLRFAPPSLAKNFSFEEVYPSSNTFGFQGVQNLWMFLAKEELAELCMILDPGTVASPQFLRLGEIYLDLGRWEEARQVLDRRLQVCSGDAEARRLLARRQPVSSPVQRVGRNDPCPCGSGKRYKHCCGGAGNPTVSQVSSGISPAIRADTLLQGALQAHQSGAWQEAETLYRRILTLEPEHPGALHYLGVLTFQKGDAIEGESLIRQAIAQDSRPPEFFSNLGLCLRRQGRHEEALQAYQEALQRKPAYPEALNNMGLDLQALNRNGEAIVYFRKAIAVQPDFAEAHWNLGLSCLVQKAYREGWEKYEWRLRCRELAAKSPPWPAGSQAWQGEDLTNKHLFLRCVQGLGDVIQTLRYLDRLCSLAGQVTLQVGPELQSLVALNFPRVALVHDGQGVVADVYSDLMSLPWRFQEGVHQAMVPAAPYLRISEARQEEFRKLLGTTRSPRIGVVWAGNPNHINDRNRSCPLPIIQSLWRRFPQCSWISLQKGNLPPGAVATMAPELVDLAPVLKDFSDTGAALMQLDLVLSVDTSVVHLAGALGRPVWVLLPFSPDWRWGLETTRSDWYESLHLFRQTAPGDWAGVLDHVARALQEKFDL